MLAGWQARGGVSHTRRSREVGVYLYMYIYIYIYASCSIYIYIYMYMYTKLQRYIINVYIYIYIQRDMYMMASVYTKPYTCTQNKKSIVFPFHTFAPSHFTTSPILHNPITTRPVFTLSTSYPAPPCSCLSQSCLSEPTCAPGSSFRPKEKAASRSVRTRT